MVTIGRLPGVLVGSPLSTPAPTSTPERHTIIQGTEENTEDAVDIIVEMPVTQREVSKVAEVVVAERTPIQARQAVLQQRLSREFETPVVAEMIVEEPMTVPPVMAQNEVIPVERHVQRAKATKKGHAPKPVKALVPQTCMKKGGVFDLKHGAVELKQFSEISKGFYPFGKKHSFIHVDKMQVAPAEYKYRPFHSRMRDILVGRLSTALAVPKQTFTLMPVTNDRPTDFKAMIINNNFYIIDGQHTYAAVMVILADPNVSDARKQELKKWRSKFVWTANVKDASYISARCNVHNGYRWEEPEYLLYLQFVRDIWVSLERPVKVVIGRKSQLVNLAVERWKVSSIAHLWSIIHWSIAQQMIG
jgi:hypothetical protein